VIDDPILDSAKLAHRLAQQLCPRDGSSPCAWYHGFWPTLRAMGIGKMSGGHAEFLADELRATAAGGARRVLTSGAADYAMPALVLDAFRRAGAPLDLTVVDRCATPLALCRWYFERQGADIATSHCDILDYAHATPFDIIVTNSFLGYFAPAERSRLFAQWRDLLRSGGALLFTNRLRPAAVDGPIGFTADEATRFRETARREAERCRPLLGLDPALVAASAQDYAAHFRSWPIRSADEVVTLLHDHGFRVDRLDCAAATGPRAVGVSGPTTADGSDYVRVAATRI
jgi:SAM-dependent methyltransferase